MKQPTTPAEWQEVVNMAEAMLLVDSARQYGLITGGPKVNAERCHQLLDDGREFGFRPKKADVDRIIQGLC
jgi:hypothetical protein